MSDRTYPAMLTRRSFLQALGAVSATALLPLRAPNGRTKSSAPPGPRLKIGVLLPPSSVYPAMGENLVAGMGLYFGQMGEQPGGPRVTLLTEPTGFGYGAAIRKARRLIEEHGVDLLVGILGTTAAAMMHDVLSESQTLLVANNSGANVARQDDQSPYIFYNTLNYWQANHEMGTWAADALGRRAIVATSLYDSLYAFRRGFESAGGEILRTHVTHTPDDTGDLVSLMTSIDKDAPDFVFAQYCGSAATDFVAAYAESGLARRIPLTGTGFLVDEGLLSAQGRAALGVTSCFTWARELGSRENQSFIRAYQRTTGREADVFSVLGFDTARLIVEAVKGVGGDVTQTNRLAEALGQVTFVGPRGSFAMDPHTHSSSSPLHVREVQRWNGAIGNVSIVELEPLSERSEQGRRMQDGPKTGWLNAYLSY